MNLPLYDGAAVFSQFSNQPDAHRGLLWTRFFDCYAADFEKPAAGDAGKFIADIAKKSCGDTTTLEHYAKRNRELIEKLGGETQPFKTQGAFMTGMGSDHPTENGFTWHHTLGVPYLPASSVKGLVRGWLEWNCDETALKKDGGDPAIRQQLKNWFGSENKDPRECDADSQAGWFIFFDALPTSAVTLAADVMTPHYDKWYEKGGDTPLAIDTVPADWHSPIPVTFLTVKKAEIQFGIAVRPGLAAEEKQQAQAALRTVMELLGEALEWFGAGAKTAVGYGRMKFDQEKTDALARAAQELERVQTEQAQLAAMSPEQRATQMLCDELAKVTGNPNPSAPIFQTVFRALEQALSWSTDTQKELELKVKPILKAKNMFVGNADKKLKTLLRQLRGEQ